MNLNDINEMTDQNFLRTTQASKFLVETIHGSLFPIRFSDILYFESVQGDYYIVTKRETIQIKKIKLKSLSFPFIRSHKSYSVNINNIYMIEKISQKLSYIHFENSKTFALLGHTYKGDFLSILKNI